VGRAQQQEQRLAAGRRPALRLTQARLLRLHRCGLLQQHAAQRRAQRKARGDAALGQRRQQLCRQHARRAEGRQALVLPGHVLVGHEAVAGGAVDAGELQGLSQLGGDVEVQGV
jgi:hypothetical protein